jgi:hypothetical protein
MQDVIAEAYNQRAIGDAHNKDMKRRIAASITSLLWALLTYIGYKLTSGVVQQHVPGYPNAGQWRYYVYFPLIMFVISFASLLLAKKIPIALFVTIWLLQLLVVLPFLFAYEGGV